METKIVYPVIKTQSLYYRNLRKITKISFIIVGIICLIVNLVIKGNPWSLIVVWSLFALWRLVFSLKLVEYSIFSHIVKIIFYVIALLFIIDYTFKIGFTRLVVPIVILITLIVMIILLYITYDKKERNIASIMALGVLVIAMIPEAIRAYYEKNWLVLVFHSTSLIILIIVLAINHKDVYHELRARLLNRN